MHMRVCTCAHTESVCERKKDKGNTHTHTHTHTGKGGTPPGRAKERATPTRQTEAKARQEKMARGLKVAAGAAGQGAMQVCMEGGQVCSCRGVGQRARQVCSSVYVGVGVGVCMSMYVEAG